MIATAQDPNWQPTRVDRVVNVVESSMRPVEVVTDAGSAFLKPLGGCCDGPHPLACEWVGSNLAKWFNLPVPDFSIIDLDEVTAGMINEFPNGRAQSGPAFISKKHELAVPWDGSREKLDKIQNPDIIPKLVLFDMWTLNWDRCPPRGDGVHRRKNCDNLLIVGDKARKRRSLLVPIDFGECFSISRELNEHVARIDRIQDERIYGFFEAFCPFMDNGLIEAGGDQLGSFENSDVEEIVSQIPDQWQVDYRAQSALCNFVYSRAQFLADNAKRILQYSNGQLF